MKENTRQDDKRTGEQCGGDGGSVPTITIELDHECQHRGCENPVEYAHIVIGSFGPSDIVGYCGWCSIVYEERQTHTVIGEVDNGVVTDV